MANTLLAKYQARKFAVFKALIDRLYAHGCEQTALNLSVAAEVLDVICAEEGTYKLLTEYIRQTRNAHNVVYGRQKEG